MNSHALAEILLALPDLPIITHSNNHSYNSETDENSHGRLKIGLIEYLQTENKYIIVGNQDISSLYNVRYQLLNK